MIDTENDALTERLSRLEIATPQFRATRAPGAQRLPVFAQAARQRRNSRGRLMLAFALLVLGVAATYPAIGPLALHVAGLLPEQVRPLTGAATYGTVQITVSGAYADQIDTVVFASFSRDAACGGGPFLTDQYGERYELTGGWGLGVGTFPVIFDPIRGSATISGASLTLHCLLYYSATNMHDVAVRLSGRLVPATARTIQAPAPIVKDGTTYEVVELVWSGTYLEVHTRISGRLIDEVVAKDEALQRNPPPGGGGVGYPGVFLATKRGAPQIPIASSDPRKTFQELYVHHVLDETRIFGAERAGDYRIVVTLDEPGRTPLTSWWVSVR